VYRYGPATLIEAGAETWLVDCGSGVTQRLLAHGTNGARITGLLLTHLHSDHTVDFIQLLLSGWHQGRTTPLRVFGPRRTRTFFQALLTAWEPEFRQRLAHELRPPEGLQTVIEEIDGAWSLQTEQVRITSTEVRHQPVPQAFGFRFEAPGASVVLSGDTAYSPELIALGQECDLLVHEAFVHWQYEMVRRNATAQQRDNIRSYHTTTAEVGLVARHARAKYLALTHFVPVVFDRERVTRDVRANFAGGFAIGDDLMSFEVSAGCVSLMRSGVYGHL
jgi:ribonuclease Z